MDKNTKIGFIGQGFIGKNLADNFSDRGFTNLVRYGLQAEYADNKEKIKECKAVFVAVPTPTTPEGFDGSILRSVLNLTGEDQIVLIKSTVPPDFMRKLHEEFKDRYILSCPEFLDENTARKNTDYPDHNIIGVPLYSEEWLSKAKQILSILPQANYDEVMLYEEASLVKYGHNSFFYFKNIFFNLLHDLVIAYGGDPEIVRKSITMDKRITETHTFAYHKGGRGAGGHCLIKDFAMFKEMYLKKLADDPIGKDILERIEKKNKELLIKSNKNLDLLSGVYGSVDDNPETSQDNILQPAI